MHVRLIQESDAIQIVDLMYEVYEQAAYSRGHGKLRSQGVVDIITRSMTMPETYPCFVHEADDGCLSGMLFGFVELTLFGDEKWLHERVFYIRQQYRSFPLMRAYMSALQEWCSEQGICRVEFGNAFAPSARLSLLYQRLGYKLVNTTYAKRI